MGLSRLFERLKRWLFIGLGLIFLVLGIIGYFLPGLPGTIWLIISATLFVRSSERLYSFVTKNKFFGRQTREFLETGRMSIKAKSLSLVSMWAFTIISLVFAPYGLAFDIPIFTMALLGTAYILTRRT